MQLAAHAILNVTRALFEDPSQAETFSFGLIFALRHLPKLTLGQIYTVYTGTDIISETETIHTRLPKLLSKKNTICRLWKKHLKAFETFLKRRRWHLRGANVSHYLAIVGGWKCIWLQGLQEGEVKQGRNVFLSPGQLSVLNSSLTLNLARAGKSATVQ